MAAKDEDRRARADVLDMLQMASRLAYEGEAPTPLDLDIDDVDDMDEAVQLYRSAVRQAAAARNVERACGVQLAGLLGKGGAVRLGPNVVRYQKGWSEACIDHDGFAAALRRMVEQGAIDVGKLVNPNSVRKTAMPQAMRDTFYEKRDDPVATLKLVPIDRAPKFLQSLEEGEVVLGRREADDG